MVKKLTFIIAITLFSLVHSEIDIEFLLDACRSHHIQNVEFCFYDFLGNKPKSIIIPLHNNLDDLENYLINGISFDGSSILGCTRITNSDMLLIPDLQTQSRKIPWRYDHTSTLRITCTMHLDKHTPYPGDPRVILQQALDTIHAMGFEFIVGPEIEFYVFEQDSDKNNLIPIDKGTYADASHDITMGNSFITIVHVLNELGLNIARMHHEVGHGQFELSLNHADALTIADSILITKDSLILLGKSYQKKITFMPKPLTNKPGNGMHINFSLFDFKNDTNAFYDEKNPNSLSTIGQSFIAGVLKHVAEFTLLLNPTVNSYKRLGGHEAPKFICCGDRNRSALIRLPNCNNNPNAVRAEIRSPDAHCNPYLAFAAILRAGIEGIKNNYQLPKLVKENLYHVDKKLLKEESIMKLPKTLQEAITVFENSTFMKEVLGDILFFNILNYKKQELKEFNSTITDWELERYY